MKLDIGDLSATAITLTSILYLLCGSLIALAPKTLMKASGYLMHIEITYTPAVSWADFVLGFLITIAATMILVGLFWLVSKP